jgi:hypothetical protein
VASEAFYSENGNFIVSTGANYGCFSQTNLTTLHPGAFTMKGTGTMTMRGWSSSTSGGVFPYHTLTTVANCFDVADTVTWANVQYLFYGCSYITSALPALWTRSPLPTSYTYCFRNCTQASNYSSVPSGWI